MELYLVPTPLAPETLHLLPSEHLREALDGVEHFLVENERTARRFLSELGIRREIRSLSFHILDKKTTAEQVAAHFQGIPPGSRVAVLSEAGAPCVADPGSRAVAHAHRNGWKVVPVPGPSAILLTLMGSGFQGQGFSFHGYLPIKEGDAAKRLKQLEAQAARTGETQLFMETPFRNQQLLRLMLSHLHPDTFLCIAANLTSEQQLLRTLAVSEWKQEAASLDLHKQPAMFAIGRPQQR
jgi:16S rRNA (cytidine1402-2'-O)-methyltransferase